MQDHVKKAQAQAQAQRLGRSTEASPPRGPRRPIRAQHPSVPRERKERMTFRIAPDVAAALRRLPNQTALVERCLREALARVCPLCHGSGEAPGVHLEVSNFKALPVGRLDRAAAAQLKALVRLGRELLATQLTIEASGGAAGELGFELARDEELLLSGTILRTGSGLELRH
jgi:hypothetical protein